MGWFKDYVLPAVTVATPLITAYIAWELNQATISLEAAKQDLDRQIAEVNVEIGQIKAQREERESRQAYMLQVFKEVKEAIGTRDDDLQKVVIALVTTLPDQQLANRWLETMQAAPNVTDDNREAAADARKVVEFNVEQRVVEVAQVAQAHAPTAVTEFDWEDYDYDIFWCEQSSGLPRGELEAESLKMALEEDGALGRIRVRMLPLSVNAQPEYRVLGYEIHANEGERAQAEALQGLGTQVLGQQFKLRPSREETRFYLSAFICPNG